MCDASSSSHTMTVARELKWHSAPSVWSSALRNGLICLDVVPPDAGPTVAILPSKGSHPVLNVVSPLAIVHFPRCVGHLALTLQHPVHKLPLNPVGQDVRQYQPQYSLSLPRCFLRGERGDDGAVGGENCSAIRGKEQAETHTSPFGKVYFPVPFLRSFVHSP